MKALFVILLSTLGIAVTTAQVKPNSLFTDHMVLQRGVPVPVWGTAGEGEKITVSFNGQTVSTNAVNGKWKVKLKKLTAGGPYAMTISGTNTVSINDVLVGEVWLCSGQSNMERQLGPRGGQKNIIDWENEVSTANYPQIREYFVPEKYTAAPVEDVNSKWEVCSPASVKNFSAVGFFFARELYKDLNVPIGLLFSAYGGTPAEHWTTRAAMESDPELMDIVTNYDKSVKDYPSALEKYKMDEKALWEKFRLDSAKAKEENRAVPGKPVAPFDPNKTKMIAGLYNAMIAPLVGYAMRGACWYQGEANNGRYVQYVPLMHTLITGWRNDWQLGDFPFLIVQIAPHKDMKPEIREAQFLISQKTKNTGLAVITDVGDSADIHPANKRPVGERLAVAAKAMAYKEKIEYSGPVYKSLKIDGDKVILSFTHTGKGLVSKDGELQGFTVAGDDNNFVPAKADIKGDKIVVYSAAVSKPVAVRFGWANVPHVNLFNEEGLPAVPFRTGY